MIQTDELFRLSLNLRYITHLVSNILCCDVKNSSWELPINIYVHKFPKIQSLQFEGLSVTGMFSSGFPSKSLSKLPLKNWLWKNTFPFSVFLTKKGHVVKFNWYCKSHGCVTHLENDYEKICFPFALNSQWQKLMASIVSEVGNFLSTQNIIMNKGNRY